MNLEEQKFVENIENFIGFKDDKLNLNISLSLFINNDANGYQF